MLPDRQSVVGREDNVGILSLAAFLKRFQDPSDLLIHMRDDGIVFRSVNPYDLLGPGKGSERFVPDLDRTVVKGMFGQVVFGNLNLIRGIRVDEFLGCLTRIVRRIEGDEHEERLVRLLPFSQELNRIVGE